MSDLVRGVAPLRHAVIDPDGIFSSVATALGDKFLSAQSVEKFVQNIQITQPHFRHSAEHEKHEV